MIVVIKVTVDEFKITLETCIAKNLQVLLNSVQ